MLDGSELGAWIEWCATVAARVVKRVSNGSSRRLIRVRDVFLSMSMALRLVAGLRYSRGDSSEATHPVLDGSGEHQCPPAIHLLSLSPVHSRRSNGWITPLDS